MNDLFEGLYSSYASDSTLSGATTGMYPTLAPEGSTFPYITFHLIASTPMWDFGGTTYEQPLIQFSIFSDKLDSPSEICQIYSDLVLLYDNTTLSMDNYTQVVFQRGNSILQRIGEEEVFMYTIDFEGIIEET